MDGQIKLRGFRIEMGEIESRLLRYRGIQEAVVIARERADGDKYLAAYYSALELVTEKQLREHLRQDLPEYMVPAAYVLLDRLPLNSSGKVDRRLLPEPVLNVEDYEPPVNSLEEKLVEVWSSVLKLGKEQLSVTRNFFELGGHSLKAIELANLLLKDMGLHVGLVDLFRYNTVRSLGEYLSEPGKEKTAMKATGKYRRRN